MLRLVRLTLLLLVLTAGCTDGGPLIFPPADRTVPIVQGTPSAEVGSTVRLGPLFALEDRYGNRTPGVRVPVEVIEGDGFLDAPFAVADPQGRVVPPDFTLDTIAGPNRLRFRPPGLPAVEFTVDGTPGELARLVPDSDFTFLGEAEVGTVLATRVGARFTDRYGNPIRNAQVLFRPISGGGLAGDGGAPGMPQASLQLTDQDGHASVPWTLGDQPGINRILIRTDILPSHLHEAMAVAGPFDSLEPLSVTDQGGQISEPVPFPPRVRAQDRLGNPLAGIEVQFRVLSGEGSVEPSLVVTDSTGIAEVSEWVLGPDEGEQVLEAAADEASTLFTARAGSSPPGPQIDVAGVHVNQGSQTLPATVDLVAGRDGLLRVFLTTPEPLDLEPEVEVELFDGSVPIDAWRIPAGSNRVESEVELERLDRSWNLSIPGDLVRPGLGVRVTVDPDGEFTNGEGTGATYPGDGGIAPLPVRDVPPLEVVLIPVRQEANGLVGRIDESSADALLDRTVRLHPVASIDWRLRTPYTTQIELTNDFERWADLLNELLAVRIDEEDGHAFYYGVAQVAYSSGIAGIGFIPSSPDRPEKVSLGWDRVNTAGYIAAHELGHNLGRRHAPCGGADRPDPNYPYPDAGIGWPGWDIGPGELKIPGGHRDFMSYCRPEWTSDYTFGGLLEWMRLIPTATALSALHSSAPSTSAADTGLLVHGRVDGAGLHLQPAFPSEGPPVLPSEPGALRLVGTAGEGEVLFDLSFRGTPVDHADDPESRHFAFRIPLDPADRARLERIELRRGGQAQAQRIPEAAGDPGALRTPPVEPEIERVGPDRVRIRWDTTRHPLAVIRDPEGRILSLARGGEVELSTRVDRLDIDLADGVRSLGVQLEVPR